MTLIPYSFVSYNAYPTVRTRRWYVIFITIISLLILLFIVSKEYFSSVIMVIIVIVYMLLRREEEPKRVVIDDNGVVINDYIYDIRTLKGYYFIHGPQVSMLYLVRHRMPDIRIYMGLETPDTIRNVFKEIRIEELIDCKESAFDLWIRVLKL